jgi:hypothetical protein
MKGTLDILRSSQGRMADSEQELQGKMLISRPSRRFGVDTPITPPRPGDEGGETHLSEYSLYFEVALLCRGMRDRQTIDVGFGLVTRSLVVLFCFVWPPTHKKEAARRSLDGPLRNF